MYTTRVRVYNSIIYVHLLRKGILTSVTPSIFDGQVKDRIWTGSVQVVDRLRIGFGPVVDRLRTGFGPVVDWLRTGCS